MKIWIKLLLGILVGVIIALFVPNKELFKNLSLLFIQIGRYGVFPLIFFSLIMGTYELRLDKRILRIYGRMLLYVVLSTILLVLVGIVSVIIFSPRIPIITVQVPPPQIPGFLDTLFGIFPANAFRVIVENGDILLPLLVLAFIIGTNLAFDRVITRPVVSLSDSLSRIFYHIVSLVVELLWLPLAIIAAGALGQILLVENLDIYRELLLILGIDLAVIVLGIYPGLLYLLDRQTNPYKILYSALAPALTGLVTGNEYLAIGMLVKHGKENLGIPRKVGSAVYSFFAVFGRAGTALVSTVSFFLILNSLLPSADINFIKILYVAGFSFIFSFALGPVPGLGAYIAITLLCYQFDAFWPTFGLLQHYKILEPIKLILVSFGVFLDVITSYLVSYVVGKQEQALYPKELRDFI
jgi:aerobic C4-dicarboxylate transport protein